MPPGTLFRQLPPYVIFGILVGLAIRLTVVFTAPAHVTDRFMLFPAFNDEASHLNRVLISEQGYMIPIQRMSVSEEHALDRGEVEYSQPPLYYLAVAPMLKAIRSLAFLRFLSLLFWIAALWILASSLPPNGIRIPLLLAGSLLGAGYIPSSTVNNDSLSALVIACSYAFAARVTHKRTMFDPLLAGSLAAVGAWTKLSLLTLWPMLLFALWQNQSRFRHNRKTIGTFAAIALAGTFMLWLSRILVYGHPLATEIASDGGVFQLKGGIVAAIYSLVCPWMELWSSWWVKLSGLAFALVLLMSSIFLLIQVIRKTGPVLDVFATHPGLRAILVTWSVGALFGVLGWLWFGIRYFQLDVRLLLPAAPFLAVMFGWPLYCLERKKRMWLGWIVAILLFLPIIALG